MQIHEVYDLAEEVELSNNLMRASGGKNQGAASKMLKSNGSVLCGYEIDSECRTEDEE